MITTNASAPNPGSDAAVALGCTCPRIDNGYGNGANGGILRDGKPVFWYTGYCPVHHAAEEVSDE